MSSVRHNGNGQQRTSRTADAVWRAPSAPQCAGKQGGRRGPDHDLALQHHNDKHRGAHMKAKQLRDTPGVDTAIPLPPAPSVTPPVHVSPHRPAAPVEVEERAPHTVALHDLCSDTTIPLPPAPVSPPVHVSPHRPAVPA